MKKILYTILLLLLLTGCSQSLGNNEIPNHLKLKAPKEKILAHKIIKQKTPMLGVIAILTEEVSDIVSYDYVSDKKVEGKFLFNGNKYTNAKILKENGNEKEVAFYVGDHFSLEIDGVYEIEQGATTTLEAWEEQTKISLLEKVKNSLVKIALAVCPPDCYSGAGDGYVRSENATWTTARTATTGDGFNYNTGGNILGSSYYSSYWDKYRFYRSFFPVDTSALPVDATISGAKFYYNISTINVSTGGGQDLVQTSQVSTSELELADVHSFSYTVGATRVDTGLGYNYFTFNGTGLTWISKTGYTKLGIICARDTDNSSPGEVNSSDIYSGYYSNQTGTDKDPYLVITYTEGGIEIPVEDIWWE